MKKLPNRKSNQSILGDVLAFIDPYQLLRKQDPLLAHNFFAALRNVVAMTFELRSGSFEGRELVGETASIEDIGYQKIRGCSYRGGNTSAAAQRNSKIHRPRAGLVVKPA